MESLSLWVDAREFYGAGPPPPRRSRLAFLLGALRQLTALTSFKLKVEGLELQDPEVVPQHRKALAILIVSSPT